MFRMDIRLFPIILLVSRGGSSPYSELSDAVSKCMSSTRVCWDPRDEIVCVFEISKAPTEAKPSYILLFFGLTGCWFRPKDWKIS
jgi:hypothetical protein